MGRLQPMTRGELYFTFNTCAGLSARSLLEPRNRCYAAWPVLPGGSVVPGLSPSPRVVRGRYHSGPKPALARASSLKGGCASRDGVAGQDGEGGGAGR